MDVAEIYAENHIGIRDADGGLQIAYSGSGSRETLCAINRV
jgi:hypothetical protein